MVSLPQTIKELEPQIAAMAPAEPNLLRLLEALRFLETTWGEDLNIRMDLDDNGHGYLRRRFKSGKMWTEWNLGVEDGKYVNYCMTGGQDHYTEVYPDFVAAAFGFGKRIAA